MDDQAKFNQLLSRMQDDADLQNKFLSNPSAVLQHLNIPVINNLRFPKALSDSELENNILATLTTTLQTTTAEIAISKHWWGINIQWSETFTSNFINNKITIEDMTQQVSSAAKIAKTHFIDDNWTRALAMAFMAKAVDIRMTNKQKGVHWPLTWPQMGLIATKPNVIGALTYAHPLHN